MFWSLGWFSRVISIIVLYALYLTLQYFIILDTLKSFQTDCRYLFYFPPKVVHFKQAAIIGFHSHLLISIDANFCLTFSKRFWSFFDRSLVYIKFLYPINKQFNINSIPDWDGHYWVFADLNQITATQLLQ